MKATLWGNEKALATFREAFRSRCEREREELEFRRERAWRLARQAAGILRKDFEAGRVVVFGSLAREADFSEYSDVDVAAWGVSDERALGAIVEIASLSEDPVVNLVVAQTARPAVLTIAMAEGVDV